MADGTAIEWARHPETGKGATWNPVTGCSVVSPGCTNCYAMKLAGTRLRHHESRKGLTRDTKAGPVWTGEVRLNEQWLDQPLRWRAPRGVFVCAHGDLFAEGVPDEWIDRVFAVMALAPQHVFFVLTKRPDRMRAYLANATRLPASGGGMHSPVPRREVLVEAALSMFFGSNATLPAQQRNEGELLVGKTWPLPNVWLGVSIEDQRRADERVPLLLDTPAARRFLSAEPLLGQIDFYRTSATMPFEGHPWRNGPILQGIDWVIAGGESGLNARPMHPDWVGALCDQCVGAGTPFFFKQWGSWQVIYDRDRDDPDWRQCSEIERRHEHEGGRWLNLAGGHGFHGERVCYAIPAKKSDAGRLLDGREWNEMPPLLPEAAR